MDSEVIRGAGPTSNRARCPRLEASTSRVTTAASSGASPPSLLTMIANGAAGPSAAAGPFGAAGPSAAGGSSAAAIRSTSAPAGPSSNVSTPGSPWMPRPSSTVPGANRCSASRPGMSAVEADTPMARTAPATRRAAAATASS